MRQQSAKLTRGPMAEKSQYLRAPSRVSVDKIAWLHQNSRAARLSISGSLHALPGLQQWLLYPPVCMLCCACHVCWAAGRLRNCKLVRQPTGK